MEKFVSDVVVAHIDDITTHSANVDDHLEHLRKILDRLIKVNMRINHNKCNLVQDKIEFLGFSVSAKGIQPLSQKFKSYSISQRPPIR